MPTLPRTIAILSCAALAAPATAAAAPTTIAMVHWADSNEVRAWRGVQAWTDYDPADQRWHVVVRNRGQISTPPAIPAGDERLRVDVGPGPDGRPALAFVSCAGVCRVVVSELDGTRARTVPGSERATAATMWGRRVAWVRSHTTVLTRSGGATKRLPGAPRGYGISALELHGSRLAFVASLEARTVDVWMESMRGGRQRLVASMGLGIANQTFAGPSWAKGRLYFYASCPCRRFGGAYRYDPGTGRYARAPAIRPLAGFAMDDDGRRAFELLDPAPGFDPEPEELTPLRLTDPLRFRASRAPIRRDG